MGRRIGHQQKSGEEDIEKTSSSSQGHEIIGNNYKKEKIKNRNRNEEGNKFDARSSTRRTDKNNYSVGNVDADAEADVEDAAVDADNKEESPEKRRGRLERRWQKRRELIARRKYVRSRGRIPGWEGVRAMLLTNFIGIVFARTIHYQF